MEHLNLKTKPNTEFNLEALYQICPACFTEVRDETTGELRHVVDFDKLKAFLGEDVAEDVHESYEFTWVGKQEARREAAKPITKTLRPCVEESVDWDTTKNLYIEGDNLEVLKLLQNSYMGKVKMIYIDPPYNTGNDFIYYDNFTQDRAEYDLEAGNVDEEGNRFRKNTETNGRFHSDWCSMIYPRLLLARNLLSDDGIVLIHIDEHEVDSLSLICKEVFGWTNELGTIIWDKRNPKGTVNGVAYQHESILAFCKNINAFANVPFTKNKEHASDMMEKAQSLIKKSGKISDDVRKEFKFWVLQNKQLSGGERAYKLIDDNGRVFRPVSMAAPDKPETRSYRPLVHPRTNKPCPVPEKGWRYKDEKMDTLLKQGKIIFGEDETTQPQQKYYLDENLEESMSSLLYYGGSDDALGLAFDNPKPVYVCSKLIKSCLKGNEDIVLDFFSGSGTVAHSVFQLNAEDKGKRQFVLVQLPQEIEEKTKAYQEGFRTICEIGKERIRRAGQKIKAEHGLIAENLDIGFRVFKCDESNMKDVYFEPKDLQQQDLINFMDNIKDDRSDLDLLFDCMLKWGVQLSEPIEKKTVGESTIYNVNDGDLVACFSEKVTQEVIDQIADLEPLRVVFRDGSFEEVSEKMNLFEIFKQKCEWSDDEVRKNVRVI